ncbi:MAG: hypothetical protein KatS3mg023_3029 [Armatimonadota bacterium]|nr:MAG: hypothetical protein KatS3mg023_3029 [Armatimonadota bacterium]
MVFTQGKTRVRLPQHTLWRLAFTAFLKPPRFAVLTALLLTLSMSWFMFKQSVMLSTLLWMSAGVVLLFAAQFILLVSNIRSRASHWQVVDFGEIVFFDGAEECIDPEEIKEYSCILSRLNQEIGIPVRHHVLGIYVIPDGMPFGVASALFRCVFVYLPVPIDNTVTSDGILQQAVPLHLLHGSRCILLPVQKIPDRLFTLGQAIIWSNTPRYVHRYSAVASLRSIGMDMRSFYLASAPKGYADLGVTLLLAFVAERKGLRHMVECYARARFHEQISLSHMVSLFGGALELERQWSERLDEARALHAHPEVEEALAFSHQLAQAGFPAEALQKVRNLLADRPHSIPLLTAAIQFAVQLRDVRECLALVTICKPLVELACSHVRLELAEGLLYHIAGEEDKARSCFQKVLETVPPVTYAQMLANRWIARPPRADWAWVELQRMMGTML